MLQVAPPHSPPSPSKGSGASPCVCLSVAKIRGTALHRASHIYLEPNPNPHPHPAPLLCSIHPPSVLATSRTCSHPEASTAVGSRGRAVPPGAAPGAGGTSGRSSQKHRLPSPRQSAHGRPQGTTTACRAGDAQPAPQGSMPTSPNSALPSPGWHPVGPQHPVQLQCLRGADTPVPGTHTQQHWCPHL